MGLIKWARKRSPWVLHFNAGSCNGCDVEVAAAFAPRYDLERFGILRRGSPRHADFLVVTGPVTRQAKDRLLRIYEQMPSPKGVVAIGTCAASGAPYTGSYNLYEGVDKILPVDVYISGCPPRPEAIIHGLLKRIEGREETR
jgi:NADH-quinone oxidoreductase B subunit